MPNPNYMLLLALTDDGTHFTADAVITNAIAGSFTADATFVSFIGTWVADAVILKTAAATFTANSVLKKTQHGRRGVTVRGSDGNIAGWSFTNPGFHEGDFLIAQINGDPGYQPPSSVPSGWNFIATASNGSLESIIYYKIATSSEPGTYTWGGAGTYAQGSIAGLKGVDTGAGVYEVLSNSGGSTDNHIAPSITTPYEDKVVVIMTMASKRNSSRTAPAPLIEIIDTYLAGYAGPDSSKNSGSINYAVYPPVVSTGTKDITNTWNVSFAGHSFTVATQLGFEADAMLMNIVSGSFTADAYLLAVRESTFTADAVIKAGLEGNFTADAVLQSTIGGSFTGDAVIASTVEGSFTADALISFGEYPFTADAVLLKTAQASFTADALLLNVVAGSFTADSVILSTIAGSVTADAVLFKTLSGSFTGDALILSVLGSTFTADAVIFKSIAGSFTADAVIVIVTVDDFTADALLLNVVSGSATADATIRSIIAGSFTGDAVLKGTFESTFTANATLLKTASATVTADATILRTFEPTVTADAVLLKTFATPFTADALIRIIVEGNVTADAVILAVQSQSFSASAVLLGIIEGTFTAGAKLYPRASRMRPVHLAAGNRYQVTAVESDLDLDEDDMPRVTPKAQVKRVKAR